MYSLDVNFLNDRPEYKPEAAARTKTRAAPTDSKQPIILGLVALVALLGISGGVLLWLQSQVASLTQKDAALTTTLGDLDAKRKEVDKIRAETKQIQSETEALAGVFTYLKPWSAVMQDVSDRIPPGIQILSVKQTFPQPGQLVQPAPSPAGTPAAATPPVSGTVQIAGLAKSFNDVNDFLLLLQKSAFLDPKATQLVASELQKEAPALSNIRLEGGGSSDNARLPPLPKQVEFTIQTAFNDVPASDLLQELNKKTAVGLVTRIEELQRKGVIKK